MSAQNFHAVLKRQHCRVHGFGGGSVTGGVLQHIEYLAAISLHRSSVIGDDDRSVLRESTLASAVQACT